MTSVLLAEGRNTSVISPKAIAADPLVSAKTVLFYDFVGDTLWHKNSFGDLLAYKPLNLLTQSINIIINVLLMLTESQNRTPPGAANATVVRAIYLAPGSAPP